MFALNCVCGIVCFRVVAIWGCGSFISRSFGLWIYWSCRLVWRLLKIRLFRVSIHFDCLGFDFGFRIYISGWLVDLSLLFDTLV